MGSSSLSEDYRLCLERERRRGRVGVCADPTLRAVLWQILVEDFDLHGVLQDDALALFTDGLWGRRDLAPALRSLARAFEVLELAALNLYLFPWRKEFNTIKMFSGGYVHSLKAVLSEDLITKSFQKMGYIRRDDHHLVVASLPVDYELIQVALGCFALRLECEILGEILTKLGTSLVSAEELIQERRASVDVDSCVDKLQRRLARGRGGDPSPGSSAAYPPGIDLYRDALVRESPTEAASYGDLAGLEPSPAELPYRPPLWEQSSKLWAADPPASSSREMRGNGTSWEPASGDEPSPENLAYGDFEDPDAETATFSFISLRRELIRTGDLRAADYLGAEDCGPDPGRAKAGGGYEPAERAGGLPASPYEVGAEPQRYQLHGCLPQGSLPAFCCDTCCQLHAGGCDAIKSCRLGHLVQELQSERQQRLWLQRTEVDSMLFEGFPRAGARP
ncbi:spermatogenesis-associated protein 2-like protein [Ornithorhynchus anatinus]|nr:spermatogenesis-associated protein 2-like protein [Ornithorhynchus anatinus]